LQNETVHLKDSARKWYSAASNNPEDAFNLATAYLNGTHGAPQDVALANKYNKISGLSQKTTMVASLLPTRIPSLKIVSLKKA
jgi:hypothetical protein